MTELNLVLSDISLAISNVEKWMAPQHVAKDLVNKFNTAFILPEPYGVVLLISPWNYPLLLTLQPLVGIIAAGKIIYRCIGLQIATHTCIQLMVLKLSYNSYQNKNCSGK